MSTVLKKSWGRVKVAGAALLSVALISGAATVISAPQSAQAAAGAFTCTSDFYQVSSGKMYQYSVASNTYSLMASGTTISGLNGIGYNTGDNYIYGVGSSSTLYKIANDGSSVASSAVTGVTPQNTGGDFIAANKLLTANNSGTFTLIDTTTSVATAFTDSGSVWAAYDLAFNPTNHTAYGMHGTTLYIGVVTGTTSIAVSTKSVTGSLAGSTDAWGAAYIDSAGDAYFFDNTTHDLVEISSANLATATPAATSITQANSLAAPNDGASCPTASSPLAPTVVTTAAGSITTTTASLNGTVATGIPVGSDVPSGGIVICYSTSNTVVGGALSVSPVCAATTPSTLPGSTAATAVTLPVTGLSAGATYYFQIQATNTFGLQAFGNVLSFTTTASPSHTVTFDNNSGSGSMANEVSNVSTALTSNSFTRAGYTFAGWNTAANGTGTPYADAASYPFTADATLYAQWTAIPAKTVTFDNNGGTGSMADEVTNVPTALTTDTFTRAGYTFSGWNTAANGTGTPYADGASYPFAADATMYAQWAPIGSQTVTFDSNGGTGSMANEFNNAAAPLSTDTFVRAGYTFAGWNTIANGTGTAYADGASYDFAADATMYAQWTAIPAKTITFNSNGGVGSMTDEVSSVPAALTTDTFTRAGYTFVGWNTASNGTGTAYADAATYPFAADATLFAQWTAIPTKTVTFDNNGGAGSMVDEVNNVPTPLMSNSFTRAGYTFVGWNTVGNGSGTSYADTASFPFAADATMFAQWSLMPVLSFDVNGGTGTVDSMTGMGQIHLPMTTVPRPGYTFVGWNTAPDGSGTEYGLGDLYTLALNDVLYAQFTKVTLAATGVETATPASVAVWFLLAGIAAVTAVAVAGRRRKLAAER